MSDNRLGRQLISQDSQQPFTPAVDADYDIVRQYWKLLEERQLTGSP